MPLSQISPEFRRLADELSKQLRANSRLIQVCALATSVVFPIFECVLVNVTTSAASVGAGAVPAIALGLLGLVHLILALVMIGSQTPLPQFLVDFDRQADTLRRTELERGQYEQFASTFLEATVATEASLLVMQHMELTRPKTLPELIQGVISPWVAARTDVFGFVDGSALYNFAVYRYDPTEAVLRLVCRAADNRIKRTNRDWLPGNGHVGICYSQHRNRFSSDAGNDETNLAATNRPEDRTYYKSIIADPIDVDKQQWGVLVVTSSQADQFEAEIHTRFTAILAILIAKAVKAFQAQP